MELKQIYHLYRRLGFGILPETAIAKESMDRKKIVDELFEDSKNWEPLTMDLPDFEELLSSSSRPSRKEFKALVMKNNSKWMVFNKMWLNRMFSSYQAVNERMTLFWTNIFVCRENAIYYAQRYNNLLRKHALGNFIDLTKGVSREPSMIKYLNTNQNKKAHPNENFARELMELFMLGEGNYTEFDIKEAARAFTGYQFRLNGDFILNKREHDYGSKSFMGYEATLDGDDVINIIARKKACAHYICSRIYTYFVNEIPNKDHIEELASVLYPSYEIQPVLKYMCMSNWFYDEENTGTKIKSPIDLLTSIYKVAPYEFEGEKEHLFIQRRTGQTLFMPPNVAGWEGGKSWINTNNMLLRLKLPSLILSNGRIPSSRVGVGNNNRKRWLKTKPAWDVFEQNFEAIGQEDLAEHILSNNPRASLSNVLSGKENLSKQDLSLQLMSLPEFQLT